MIKRSLRICETEDKKLQERALRVFSGLVRALYPLLEPSSKEICALLNRLAKSEKMQIQSNLSKILLVIAAKELEKKETKSPLFDFLVKEKERALDIILKAQTDRKDSEFEVETLEISPHFRFIFEHFC